MATATLTRRQVRYASLDEVVADAERAVSANSGTTGKWSLGQIIEHLAVANDKLIDGFGFRAAWPLRTAGRLFFKKRVLAKGLTPGFNLSPKAAAVLVPGETDAAAALVHLRKSTERLKFEQKRSAHPFLGPLTVDECNQLCLRHAELHMSFVTD
ncbi:MAG TPA: DUF1569 domain-containing protein [Planctomycetaceae bacterium]|jgi:hypothetical protein|nr:DUF1569 domain-containing protein [Planctomycetaceae bacterium]